MFFERIYERGLAQASYLVGCQATGEAIVIDPNRDTQRYVDLANREGLSITMVTETHIHADYLSGAPELAAATGAQLLLSDEGGRDWQYGIEHTPLYDGSTFFVGKVRFDVLHTPGHTPEHVTFLLTDTATSGEPRMLFTGDFVFVGDVGRPDLLDEAAGMTGTREVGARALFQSIRRLDDLPGHVQIWPGHGAGSACGKSLGAVPGSTLGFERVSNWAFTTRDVADFVSQLLDGQPEAPYYFAEMKRLNRDRPRIAAAVGGGATPAAGGGATPVELDPAAVRAALGTVQIVDVRDGDAWAAGHVPGSFCVPFDESMANWFGWVLDYDRPIVLVATPEEAREAVLALRRIGLDTVRGYLPPDRLDEVGAVERARVLAPDEAVALWRANHPVLDVRSGAEFDEGHLDGAVNVHAGRLRRHLDMVPAGDPLVVYCESGYRSTIALSVLAAMGRGDAAHVRGGYAALRQLDGARDAR